MSKTILTKEQEQEIMINFLILFNDIKSHESRASLKKMKSYAELMGIRTIRTRR